MVRFRPDKKALTTGRFENGLILGRRLKELIRRLEAKGSADMAIMSELHLSRAIRTYTNEAAFLNIMTPLGLQFSSYLNPLNPLFNNT